VLEAAAAAAAETVVGCTQDKPAKRQPAKMTCILLTAAMMPAQDNWNSDVIDAVKKGGQRETRSVVLVRILWKKDPCPDTTNGTLDRRSFLLGSSRV